MLRGWVTKAWGDEFTQPMSSCEPHQINNIYMGPTSHTQPMIQTNIILRMHE